MRRNRSVVFSLVYLQDTKIKLKTAELYIASGP